MLFLRWSYLCFCMSISSTLTKQLDIDAALQEGMKESQLMWKENLILLVGGPQVDIKSFSEFIRKDETWRVVKNEEFESVLVNVGTKNRSQSSEIPEIILSNIDQESGTAIAEFRCLLNNSVEHDLLAAVKIRNTLNSARRVKIVVIESYRNIKQSETSSNEFLATIGCVANMIKNNIDSFQGAIGLVATEVNESGKTDQEIQHDIEKIVVSTREKLMEEYFRGLSVDKKNLLCIELQIKIIKFLIEGNNFGLFRATNSLENPLILQSLSLNYDLDRQLIFEKMNYSTQFKELFGFNIASKTMSYVNEQLIEYAKQRVETRLDVFCNSITNFIDYKTNLQPFIKDLNFTFRALNNIIRQYDNVNQMEKSDFLPKTLSIYPSLKRNNTNQAFKLRFLSKVVGKSSEDLETDAIEMFDKKVEFFQHFNESKVFIDFCRKLVADFDTYPVQLMDSRTMAQFQDIRIQNFDDWKVILKNSGFRDETVISASKFIVDQSKVDIIFELIMAHYSRKPNIRYHPGAMYIVGEYLILSQFSENIQKNTNHQIFLIAKRKLFIDCDITLFDKHLTIVGPLIEVVEVARKIHTRGGHAPTLENMKASSKNGENGRNGYSSGQLTIMSLNIDNPHLLEVSSVGGDGSAGQDGADAFAPSCNIPSFPSDISGSPVKVLQSLRSYYYYANVKINSELELYQFEVTVTGSFPEKPGDGGDAGEGAEAGPQFYYVQNRTSIAHITKNYNFGVTAIGGKGGKGEAMIWCKKIRHIFCKKEFVIIYRFQREKNVICEGQNTYEMDISTCVDVKDGKPGEQGLNHPLNYRHQPNNFISIAIEEFCALAIQSSGDISEEPVTINFLEFVLTNTEILEILDISDYMRFVGIMDSNMKEDTRFSNIEVVYKTLYRSFRLFTLQCTDCNILHLEKVNLLFVSRLNFLQTLTTGNNVVRLKAEITNFREKLTDIQSSSSDLKIIELLHDEIMEVSKQIIKAGEMIEKTRNDTITDIKERVDRKFTDILTKTKTLKKEYEKNILELEEQERSIKENMILKGVVGTLGSCLTFAGIFYPPAALIGGAMLSVANQLNQKEDVDIKSKIARAPKGLENAAGVIADYKERRCRDDEYRKMEQMKALKLVLEAEESTGELIIIDEERRESIRELVEKYESYILESKNSHAEFVISTSFDIIDYVDKSLDDRIKKLEKIKATGKKTNFLISVKKSVSTAKKIIKAASTVIDVVSTYREDKAELSLIESAIDSNKVAFQEMARYEKVLNDEFLPMLEDMVNTLIEIPSKNSNSVILLLQKIDVKKHARRFVALIKQFTEEFVDDGNGIASVFVDMEEYMTLIIDSYDKLNELHYRMQLKEFIGRINGGDCSHDEDPIFCAQSQELANNIAFDEISRMYVKIINAYKHNMFPYGGDVIQMFQSTFSKLRNSSNITVNEKAKILQGAIDLSINELDDMQNTIVNDRDKHFKNAVFNSKYFSSKSFFMWSNKRFANEIKMLFKGEQITLSSSILNSEVKNAVKFTSLMLNVTSSDPSLTRAVHDLLLSFTLRIVHLGDNYYRCGNTYYVIGGDPHEFTVCFQSVCDMQICKNVAFEKRTEGDVPLSPYTVWNFQLEQIDGTESQLTDELQAYAEYVDIELVGTGYFIDEEAPICNTDLGKYYQIFDAGL